MSGEDNERYANRSQQRLMAVEEALLADPSRPRTVAALGRAVEDASRDQVYRALLNLETRERAVRAGDDGWTAGRGLYRLALAASLGVDR